MSASETGDALVAVTRLAAQVAQLQLRLLTHAERVDVGAEVGATSPANWLAHRWPEWTNSLSSVRTLDLAR